MMELQPMPLKVYPLCLLLQRMTVVSALDKCFEGKVIFQADKISQILESIHLKMGHIETCTLERL